ncbi:zinc finger protein ZFP2 [Plutella xylostella]|uniref:zinc finger protein ZFP2 n=1 Tax=Plutella xylostella TaxID=51655 RepID=UPI0020329640|nr:zinc finger protein ZFP2 [Plutella xylostella]
MNTDRVYSRTEFCNCCLVEVDTNKRLTPHTLQNELFKSIIEERTIILCSLCKRLAQNVECFLQNVENVQKLFMGVNSIDRISLETARMYFQPALTLSTETLPPVEVGAESAEGDLGILGYPGCVVLCSGGTMRGKVKEEVDCKEESDCGNGGDDFYEADHSSNYIKEEDFSAILKGEIEAAENSHKKKKKLKKHKKSKVKRRKTGAKKDADKLEILYITKEQSIQELKEMCLNNTKFLNSPLKCMDCAKGFAAKSTFDAHMALHSESNGSYVCDICGQRRSTPDQFNAHYKTHTIRYRCVSCGTTRAARHSVLDHHARDHGGTATYKCAHCPKIFLLEHARKKHCAYAHGGERRVTCDYCQKNFASKVVLRTHMQNRHSTESGVEPCARTHECETCGKAFRALSTLNCHRKAHSDEKQYYCVECNRTFKSASSLSTHLTTTNIHVKYKEHKYACELCDRRFTVRRDLDRHVNSVHLNLKPHQCDKCEKAYVDRWSLRVHQRLTHEGLRRPPRYPCALCGRVFDRNQILKSHMRTHTGERPYQCAQCPAAFAQSASLWTHNKLIHLKTTRKGLRKKEAV